MCTRPTRPGPDPRRAQMSEENMEKLRQSLIGAKRDEGIEATQALLEEGADPVIILQDGMATAMFTLGAMWSRGEV
ncbi:MAG: B12-binding domain-containing protein, partial [Actinomycetota bacterium]